jgi:hypothetical protein
MLLKLSPLPLSSEQHATGAQQPDSQMAARRPGILASARNLLFCASPLHIHQAGDSKTQRQSSFNSSIQTVLREANADEQTLVPDPTFNSS